MSATKHRAILFFSKLTLRQLDRIAVEIAFTFENEKLPT